MDITPNIPAGRQLIRAYGDGGFKIAGTSWIGSVLVLPTVTTAWEVASVANLDLVRFEAVIEARPDILLMGCGPHIAAVPRDLRAGLRAHGIVMELMDTGAACRTFNVLLAEDRKVAAALIAV